MPKPEPAYTPALLASRQARLATLLRMDAPSELIKVECQMVLAAHCGGDLAAIRWQLRSWAVGHWRWHLQTVQAWLHRRWGVHFREDGACWICDCERGDDDAGDE